LPFRVPAIQKTKIEPLHQVDSLKFGKKLIIFDTKNNRVILQKPLFQGLHGISDSPVPVF